MSHNCCGYYYYCNRCCNFYYYPYCGNCYNYCHCYNCCSCCNYCHGVNHNNMKKKRRNRAKRCNCGYC